MQSFALKAFLHGQDINADNTDHPHKATINQQHHIHFDVPLKDTYANRTSFISVCRYRAYCGTFSLLQSITILESRIVAGIGGMRTFIGEVAIEVRLTQLEVVTEMAFRVLEDNILTCFSMKDMLDNSFHISNQERYVSL